MINIQCIILIVGGCVISRPYPNVSCRFRNLLFFTKKSFYHQGEWIEVRFMVLVSGFQHLVGDHLFGGKINWERRKMQIHAPLNIVKMY